MLVLRTDVSQAFRRGAPRRFIRVSNVQALSTTADSTAASTDASASQTVGRKRQITYVNRRPNISLTNPREWNRPLAPGVLPAYDEALKYIRKDSKNLTAQADEIRAQLQRAQQSTEVDEAGIQKLKEKLNILEIQSEINLPDVRWKLANGMADLSKPVYRHLMEQRWRKDGDLDLLMERIYQMHVVPDVVGELQPTFDLRITFPEAKIHRNRGQRYSQVEPGIFLTPQQTREPPKLYADLFHVEPVLYTLLMVDLDVPDETNQGYQNFVLWLQPNISLSAASSSQLHIPTSHTPYIPPHPQRGTPYHRYIILFLPQAEEISVPVLSFEQRLGFDVRQFMATYGLDKQTGGAVHMWREVWDEEVSKIYQDVLKLEEPRFGRPPKRDRYAEMKSTKRYI